MNSPAVNVPLPVMPPSRQKVVRSLGRGMCISLHPSASSLRRRRTPVGARSIRRRRTDHERQLQNTGPAPASTWSGAPRARHPPRSSSGTCWTAPTGRSSTPPCCAPTGTASPCSSSGSPPDMRRTGRRDDGRHAELPGPRDPARGREGGRRADGGRRARPVPGRALLRRPARRPPPRAGGPHRHRRTGRAGESRRGPAHRGGPQRAGVVRGNECSGTRFRCTA